MRCVIDNNQLSSISRSSKRLSRIQKRRITVILPPRVWSEALLGPDPTERLTCLAEFVLRFGMDYADIISIARNLTGAQLSGFQPIVPGKGRLHRNLLKLLRYGASVVTPHACLMKQEVISTNQEITSKIAAANRQNRDAMSRCEDIIPVADVLSIDHAMQLVGRKHQWFALTDDYGSAHQGNCSDCGGIVECDHYEHLRNNPNLDRFARLVVCRHLGYTNSWRERALNVTLAGKRDDFTDLTLALYAADGDVILTADGKFRDAFRYIDPYRKVQIKTWDELVKNGMRRLSGR